MHDIDACECDAISTEDMLGFDNDCKCLKSEVEDPDEDLARRIN